MLEVKIEKKTDNFCFFNAIPVCVNAKFYKIFALQSVSNVILNNFILGICGCLHRLRLSLAFYLQAGRMESDISFLLISCIIFVLMPVWWLTSCYSRLSTTTIVSLIVTEWPTCPHLVKTVQVLKIRIVVFFFSYMSVLMCNGHWVMKTLHYTRKLNL